MKRLLAFYSKQRDRAKAKKDGERFLYWSARCTECLTLMEDK